MIKAPCIKIVHGIQHPSVFVWRQYDLYVFGPWTQHTDKVDRDKFKTQQIV